MINSILEWIADRSVVISVIALIAALLLRLESRLSRRWKDALTAIDVTLAVAIFFLGVLKDGLDEKWQRNLEERVAGIEFGARRLTETVDASSPRTISIVQRERIAGFLARAPLGGSVHLCYGGSDSESMTYATELGDALKAAGVSVTGLTELHGFPIVPGKVTVVGSFGAPTMSRDQLEALLRAVGVQTGLASMPSWGGAPDDVRLLIGSKRANAN